MYKYKLKKSYDETNFSSFLRETRERKRVAKRKLFKFIGENKQIETSNLI